MCRIVLLVSSSKTNLRRVGQNIDGKNLQVILTYKIDFRTGILYIDKSKQIRSFTKYSNKIYAWLNADI